MISFNILFALFGAGLFAAFDLFNKREIPIPISLTFLAGAFALSLIVSGFDAIIIIIAFASTGLMFLLGWGGADLMLNLSLAFLLGLGYPIALLFTIMFAFGKDLAISKGSIKGILEAIKIREPMCYYLFLGMIATTLFLFFFI
jgi:hypothetical protein